MTSKYTYNMFFFSGSGGSNGGQETIICTNCSQQGHTSKHCPKPITSYGVILFRVRGWNQADALIHGSPTGYDPSKHHLEFLLIQRRDSISFIEIMRGKYKVSNHEYIIQLLNGMTAVERERLLTEPFESLWEGLWGVPLEISHSYKYEREQARQKLELLRTGQPSLQDLIARAGPAWTTPEWGFPKGRRDLRESEFACAMREMWEETNIHEKDICVVRGLDPLEEEFRGTNDITYLHKYYVTYVPDGTGGQSFEQSFKENPHIRREVGDIQWCSLERALSYIRDTNEEKRKVLLRAAHLLSVYCPLFLGSTSFKWRAAGPSAPPSPLLGGGTAEPPS
jgi:8-oxo-dGTP pyrophosphatase MutT (NUDIX family)